MIQHPRGGLDDVVARLLPDLSTASRKTLVGLAREERPPSGTYLMREGRPTHDLGLIVDGRLAVRGRVGRDDGTLMTLEPGDAFGWSAVLDGISTASIMALDGARVLLFERDGLRAALAADPKLAAVIYRRLLEAVSSRLDATRMLMLDVYGQGVPAR